MSQAVRSRRLSPLQQALAAVQNRLRRQPTGDIMLESAWREATGLPWTVPNAKMLTQFLSVSQLCAELVLYRHPITQEVLAIGVIVAKQPVQVRVLLAEWRYACQTGEILTRISRLD